MIIYYQKRKKKIGAHRLRFEANMPEQYPKSKKSGVVRW